ncbi:DHA2 family efflux MFS transporter permease subunit [Nocardia sp. NPDC052566]|uniref:DHA2 family efflux MFS transporter permease subunit n=1 Tax=Nocardia sp. NPDC052566 TaxID=3364330 RepID=UPI0037CA41EC
MTHRNAPARAGAERIPLRAWLTLLAVAVGAFVTQIDGLVVAVASPDIAAGLRAGPAQIQWVSTAQLLALASLAIPAGTLADRFGRKRIFLLGVGGFTASSLLCGLAGSIELLIGGRVLQGASSALLLPAALGALRAAFPPNRLPTALGVFGSVTALALTGAPQLGGWLVEHLGWSWAFFVTVPFGILGIGIGALVISESAQRVSNPLDLPGVLTSTIAVVSLAWAVTGVQDNGWASAQTIGLAVVSIVFFAGFLVVERLSAHPMVPLGLFRNRSFSVGLVLLALTLIGMSAVTFYLMFYLQGVQGKRSADAATALLPLFIAYMIAPPTGGLLTQRFGARATMMLGAACNAIAFAFLLRLAPDSATLTLAVPLALIGVGTGFLMVASMEAVLGTVPAEQAGVAAGVKQAVSQLASTLGIAGFGTLLASLISAEFPDAVRTALAPNTALAEQVAEDPGIQQQVGLGFPPSSTQTLPRDLTDTVVTTITDTAHRVFTDGVHVVFGVCIVIAVLAGALAVFVRDPNTESPCDTDRPARAVDQAPIS